MIALWVAYCLLYCTIILRGWIRLDRVALFTREGVVTRTDLIQSDPGFVANPCLGTFKPLYCSFPLNKFQELYLPMGKHPLARHTP